MGSHDEVKILSHVVVRFSQIKVATHTRNLTLAVHGSLGAPLKGSP